MKKKLNTNATLLFLIMLLGFLCRATYNRLDLMEEGVPAQYGYETSQVAKSIATGHGFGNPYPLIQTGPTAIMPPVYPYLLAGIYKVFGVHSSASYLVATSLSGLFSTLTCIPIFFLGRRLGGDICGLVAAGLWAVFPTAIALSTGPISGVWDTTLAALCAALVLSATLAVRDSDRVRTWAAYGLLLAFALEVNPSIFSTLPFLFLWLCWELRKRKQSWMKLTASAALLAVLGCAPWCVRNYTVFHRFIPFRSNLGLELWLGNNSEFHDIFPDWRSPYTSRIETGQFARLGEMEFMREKERKAVAYMTSNPWATASATYRRFIVTWTGLAVRLKDIWPEFKWADRLTFIFNIVIAIGGWMGVWLLVRRRSECAIPFLVFLVFYPSVYYLTHSTLRYRHPIDPALMVLTTFCVAAALRAAMRPANARPILAAPDSVAQSEAQRLSTGN
jgi:4-amino-4-deoxy-L-arabinose transferase-like glycosyltransferase